MGVTVHVLPAGQTYPPLTSAEGLPTRFTPLFLLGGSPHAWNNCLTHSLVHPAACTHELVTMHVLTYVRHCVMHMHVVQPPPTASLPAHPLFAD